MESLTFIEIDISFCTLRYGETTGVGTCPAVLGVDSDIKCFNSVKTCAVPASYIDGDVTLRFAKPVDYLPREIDCIPSIAEVSLTPATISLGENLGTRSTLQVTFIDHPHSDTGDGYDKYLSDRTYDPFSQGTFWGKFRSRQPFLRGRTIRFITGLVGDALVDMETRHFIVDSFDGPTPAGKYTLVAKDILKLADGDRSQAPPLSSGFLSADITAIQTSANLLPSGVGNAEYPSGGLMCFGGNEIVSFSRTNDVLSFSRAQLGTTASTHKAQDRAQLVLHYSGNDVAEIMYDLLGNYAGISTARLPLTAWQDETATFLGTVYTGTIVEPTSVATLMAELIQQAALAVWWDDIDRLVKMQVLRGVVTDADTFTPENILQGSLTIKEQPDKRVSRVQVYFGAKDPTKPLSNLDNFRSSSLTVDEESETQYHGAAIKTITARWIPEAGRSIADRVGAIILARYRDPPRQLTFATSRYAETDISIGQGYRVESFCIQDATGAQSDIPIQVTRLNPGPDRFSAEAEEMLWNAPAVDLADRQVIFGADTYNINLRTQHDTIYPAPVSGDVVTCTINAGVIIGSTSTALQAFDVGIWPSGVTINLILLGRIEGRGGSGGTGAYAVAPFIGAAGLVGGDALYTRTAINLQFPPGGELWGGGGGGGGGGAGGSTGGGGGGGGGGGAGQSGGNGGGGSVGGGGGGYPGSPGASGSAPSGGGGGSGGVGFSGSFNGGSGANGGSPGVAGTSGAPGGFGGAGGAGGAAGHSIDGVSFVTVTVSGGDSRGSQVN